MLRRARFGCRYWHNSELLSFAVFFCGAMQVYSDMCNWQAHPNHSAAQYILSNLNVDARHIIMALRGEAMAMFVAALKFYPDVLMGCSPTEIEALAFAVMRESRDSHTDSIFRVLMLKIGVEDIQTGNNFAYKAYLHGASMHRKPSSVMRVIRALPGFSELKNTTLYEETMRWGNAYLHEGSKVADLMVFCDMCLQAHFNDQMAAHVIELLIHVMERAAKLGNGHVGHIRMVTDSQCVASWEDLLLGVEAMVARDYKTMKMCMLNPDVDSGANMNVPSSSVGTRNAYMSGCKTSYENEGEKMASSTTASCDLLCRLTPPEEECMSQRRRVIESPVAINGGDDR